ncbi:MAG TPA: methyltransferase domain-containing protein [Baekduia sp.]|nr:methyltransferase domain-containing protein [Baekduia sp.]
MGLADVLRNARWRAAGHMTRPLDHRFTAPLRGAAVLEIGGPSRLFAGDGLLPVYPIAASVDNVQFAAETAWHDLSGQPDFAPEDAPLGVQHLLDGAHLEGLADDGYDAVISSHVIEHLADPLGGLEAWARVARPGGHLLMVAPHHEGTFDRRRPVTTLQHMVDDHAVLRGEDDLTHLEETLLLHDHRRDVPQDRRAWEAERRDNVHSRVLHHHVFSTPSLLALLDHAGLELLACETRFPHDIYVLARFPGATGDRPDNTVFLQAARRSPFRSDRGHGARPYPA